MADAHIDELAAGWSRWPDRIEAQREILEDMIRGRDHAVWEAVDEHRQSLARVADIFKISRANVSRIVLAEGSRRRAAS